MTTPKRKEPPLWEKWRATGRHRLARGYVRADARTHGGASLLRDTWQAFSEDDGATRAAAIGYYALISLFPITVLLALSLTALVGETMARYQVSLITLRYLPATFTLVDDIVGNVIANRGALSTLALGALAWSGLQIFRVLERAINRAWGAPRRRGLWRTVSFSIAMIAVAGALTLLSVALTSLFEIAQARHLTLPVLNLDPLDNPFVWGLVSALPPFALTMALFAFLYRFVPHRVTLSWRDVWPGALFAALLWEGAKQLFAFYLAAFARQNMNLLYGSVGAVLALLTWLYVTGYIVLLGAEFCAVLARHRREQTAPPTRGHLTPPPLKGAKGEA